MLDVARRLARDADTRDQPDFAYGLRKFLACVCNRIEVSQPDDPRGRIADDKLA